MYIMSYFKEKSLAVHIAVSEDLRCWRELNGGAPVISFSESDGKIVRDPFIIRAKDGRFHLFFTDNWKSSTIGYSSSLNLLDWDAPVFLNVSEGLPPVDNCWAPECVYDVENGRYLLFWSSRLKGEPTRMDKMYCRSTTDFVNYSEPKVLLAPGYPVIDASIYHHDGVYFMCVKDERGENVPENEFKALRTCTSRNAEGPYEDISPLLTHNFCEGPTIIRRDGKFVVFFDAYRKHYYGAMESANFRDFTDVTDQFAFPDDCKHCTVIEVDALP